MDKIVASTEVIKRITVIRDVGTNHDAEKTFYTMALSGDYKNSRVVGETNVEITYIASAPSDMDSNQFADLIAYVINVLN